MAQQAGADGPVEHDPSSVRRITRDGGERRVNRIFSGADGQRHATEKDAKQDNPITGI
jgi:hypothetical protein